jgi:hypothetical protein
MRSNYNEEHRLFVAAKIVATARSILSGELSIIARARKLAGWRFDVGAEKDPDFIFFVGVNSETDHLPIGEERSHWNPDALKQKYAELKILEASMRQSVFEVCRSLIQKYEPQKT